MKGDSAMNMSESNRGEATGGEPANSMKNKDAFMTDAIQLIGVIYKYAKMRNIPGPEFERIIVNSYDVAW